ncbi:hypothetical protein [Roseateles sp. YR242]|uniref:hypothetical protein n=1 Tax=Roseateles sp. YR242 TaxID=1855305 RepID=UPI000B8377EF|nr:hypothetical protein [Roseateles sp. YR242]
MNTSVAPGATAGATTQIAPRQGPSIAPGWSSRLPIEMVGAIAQYLPLIELTRLKRVSSAVKSHTSMLWTAQALQLRISTITTVLDFMKVLHPTSESDPNLNHLSPAEQARFLARLSDRLCSLSRLDAKRGLPFLLTTLKDFRQRCSTTHSELRVREAFGMLGIDMLIREHSTRLCLAICLGASPKSLASDFELNQRTAELVEIAFVRFVARHQLNEGTSVNALVRQHGFQTAAAIEQLEDFALNIVGKKAILGGKSPEDLIQELGITTHAAKVEVQELAHGYRSTVQRGEFPHLHAAFCDLDSGITIHNVVSNRQVKDARDRRILENYVGEFLAWPDIMNGLPIGDAVNARGITDPAVRDSLERVVAEGPASIKVLDGVKVNEVVVAHGITSDEEIGHLEQLAIYVSGGKRVNDGESVSEVCTSLGLFGTEARIILEQISFFGPAGLSVLVGQSSEEAAGRFGISLDDMKSALYSLQAAPELSEFRNFVAAAETRQSQV